MEVPPEVVQLVQGSAVVDRFEQVFSLITVDDHGYPHICLLSRTELATTDPWHLCAVVRGKDTTANLERTRRATLTGVQGTSSHQLKLHVVDLTRDQELVAIRFEVTWHRADDLGIPLNPTTFVPTRLVAEQEDWDRVEALLAGL